LRVLLDAHVSNRRVGEPLRRSGHDVLALDQDEVLGSLTDEEVLALAVEEERVVITHNVRHFVPIVRSWIEAQRPHRGVILVTLAHTDYGAILRGLERAFAARPDQDDWVDRAEFLGHG
jgi:predicted nuclease of predicted toxin-antitoxin system